MAQEEKLDPRKEPLGQVFQRIVDAYAASVDEDRDIETRMRARSVYDKGLDLIYPLSYDDEIGSEVIDFIQASVYTDARRRLTTKGLYPIEVDTITKVQEAARQAARGEDEKGEFLALAKALDLEPYDLMGAPVQLFRVPEPEEILSSLYSTTRVLESEDNPYTDIVSDRSMLGKMRALVQKASSSDFAVHLDDYQVSEDLYERVIDWDGMAYDAAEFNAAVMSNPVQEVNGIRYVDTPRGRRVLYWIPDDDKSSFLREWAIGGGSSGPIARTLALRGREAIQELIGWNPWMREGEDYNVRAFGHFFPLVPPYTGNPQRDAELLKNPLYVRSLMEAERRWQITMGISSTPAMLAEAGLASTGGGRAFALAGKAVTRGPMLKAIGKTTGTAARAAAGGAPAAARVPVAAGDARAVWEMFFYDAAAAAVVGDRTIWEGIREGAEEGIAAGVFGKAARLGQRVVFNPLTRRLLYREAGRWRGWNWVRRLADPSAEASEFALHVDDVNARVSARLERQMSNTLAGQVASGVWSAAVVGQGFGALAYAREKLAREGVEWGVDAPGALDAFLEGLTSREALGTSLGFVLSTGVNSAAQWRDATRPDGAARRHIHDVAESANKFLTDLSPEWRDKGYRYFSDLLKDQDASALVDYVREELGRDEPREGDPFDPDQVGVRQLNEWMRDDPEFVGDTVQRLSGERLTSLLAEVRGGSSVPEQGTVALRDLIQGELDIRAQDPARESEAASGATEARRGRRHVAEDFLSSESLQQHGLRAPRHALNAVNRYLGKKYKSPAEITREDFEAMLEARRAAKGTGDPAGAAAALEASGQARTELAARRAGGEGVSRRALDELYDALRSRPEYLGLSRLEVLEDHLGVGFPRLDEARVAEALEQARQGEPRPAPEAEGSLPGHGVGRDPDLRPTLVRTSGRDSLRAVGEVVRAAAGPRADAELGSILRDSLLALGPEPAAARLLDAATGVGERAETARRALLDEAREAAGPAAEQARALGLLSDAQLAQPRTRRLLGLVALGQEEVPGGLSRARPGLELLRMFELAAEDPAAYREDLGFDDPGAALEFVQDRLPALRETVRSVELNDPVRQLGLRIAENFHGNGRAVDRPVPSRGGRSPRQLAEELYEAVSGRPARRVAVPARRLPTLPEAASRPPGEQRGRETYRRAVGHLDAAFEAALRLRVPSELGEGQVGWEGALDPSQPADSARNSPVVRALVEGRDSLRQAFLASREPDGSRTWADDRAASGAFDRASRHARAAVTWARDSMIRLAEADGGADGVRDVLDAARLQNLGEPLPDHLVRRLRAGGMLDESTGVPTLREGAQKQLARDFLERFTEEAPGAEVALHGLADPLGLLSGLGLVSMPIDADERSVLNRTFWRNLSLPRFLDWVRDRHLAGTQNPLGRAADLVLSQVYKHLWKPLWVDFFALPERSVFLDSRTRNAMKAYRRAGRSWRGVAQDFRHVANVMSREMLSWGMTEQEGRLFVKAVEIGARRRFRDADEFARVMKMPPERAGRMLDWIHRYVDLGNEMGQRLVDLGALTPAQYRRWRGRWIANFRVADGDPLVKSLTTPRGLSVMGIMREASREADPVSDAVRQAFDPRQIIPVSTAQESREIESMGVLRSLADGHGSMTGEQYRREPRTNRVLWERVAVRPEELAAWNSKQHRELYPSETHEEYRERMRSIRPRQIMLGKILDQMRRSMEPPGVLPRTPEKKRVIRELYDRYVPSNVAEDLNTYFTLMDPSYQDSRLEELVVWWKRNKVPFNVRNWVLDLSTSFLTNSLSGKTSLADFFRGLSGSGPYAKAWRGLGEWEQWYFGQGQFEGSGPRNAQALQGHRYHDLILQVDEMVKGTGGSVYASTLLEPVSAGDMFSPLLTPSPGQPVGLSGAKGLGAAIDVASRRVAPVMKSWEERYVRLLGSPNPREQVEAMRVMLGMRNMWELSFKIAGAFALMEKSPGLTVRDYIEASLEGTGDYGAANPHFRRWTTMFRPGQSPMMREASEALRRARGRSGALPEGQRRAEVGPAPSARQGFGEELRRIASLYTPETVRAGGKVLGQSPFLLYPHVMVPTLLRKAAMHPVLTAVTLGASAAFIRLASRLGGGEEEELAEGLAGQGDVPEDAFMALPSEDALDEFVRRYGDSPPWALAGLGDAEGALTRAWAGQRELMRDVWRDALRGSREIALARMPNRGSTSRYALFSEGLRPLSTGTAALSGWHYFQADSVPKAHAVNFWDANVGLLGRAAMGAIGSGMELVGGRKGRSYPEVLYDNWSGFTREAFSFLNPATTELSPQMARILEFAVAGDQRWQDVIAGTTSEAVARQDRSEQAAGLAAELVFPVREVRARDVERVDRGGAMSQLRSYLDLRLPKPAAADETQHELDVLSRRTREVIRQSVVDNYFLYREGEGIPLSFRDMMIRDLYLEGDLGEDGLPRPDPRSRIGRLARDQIARGHDPAMVLRQIRSELIGIAGSEAVEVVSRLALRREVDPSIVGRIWESAADGGRVGLLEELHRLIVREGAVDHSGSVWWILRENWGPLYQPTDPKEAKLLGDLRTHFGGATFERPTRPYAEALGPRAPVLAPKGTLGELEAQPDVGETRRRLLRGLIQ